MNTSEKGDMELIASDAYSGIDNYEASVIQDSKSLNKFYGRINQTRKPGLPVPQVDFSKNVLLVMCLGKQKGETTPLLTKTEEENNILITIELSDKTSSLEAENSLMSYPFYIYKLQHTSKEVSIQKSGF
ncbi:hypothetical protein [uncultured Allomuricauda sp.]|uniref:hypothetical protein n=1 Tax=Flagellimonas sp. W118 TaxID=3410791 RepID=UPI002626FFF3|nr:hypothetical protein [uncultured Allomuricauda sp.]